MEQIPQMRTLARSIRRRTLAMIPVLAWPATFSRIVWSLRPGMTRMWAVIDAPILVRLPGRGV